MPQPYCVTFPLEEIIMTAYSHSRCPDAVRVYVGLCAVCPELVDYSSRFLDSVYRFPAIFFGFLCIFSPVAVACFFSSISDCSLCPCFCSLFCFCTCATPFLLVGRSFFVCSFFRRFFTSLVENKQKTIIVRYQAKAAKEREAKAQQEALERKAAAERKALLDAIEKASGVKMGPTEREFAHGTPNRSHTINREHEIHGGGV